MTIGTAIVISILTICATLVILCAMGMSTIKKKQSTAEQLTKEILKNRHKE